MDAGDYVIVALDVPSRDINHFARILIEEAGIRTMKLGLEIACEGGIPRVTRLIHAFGGRIFGDLKVFDIPRTVGAAVNALANQGVEMFTIPLEAPNKSLEVAIANKGAMTSIAVTLLSSMEEDECWERYGLSRAELVVARARKAQRFGFDAITVPAWLLPQVDSPLIKVATGIRPVGSSTDDQVNAITPEEAVSFGAHHVVIGRPITQATDPAHAAKQIVAEITVALKEKEGK